jgi:hypothetical protein
MQVGFGIAAHEQAHASHVAHAGGFGHGGHNHPHMHAHVTHESDLRALASEHVHGHGHHHPHHHESVDNDEPHQEIREIMLPPADVSGSAMEGYGEAYDQFPKLLTPGAMLPHPILAPIYPRIPIPSEIMEEPLYVNAKQYHRILKRRQARAKLEAEHKIPKQRRAYLHESRHRHALRRARGNGGRFLTSKEKQKLLEEEKKDDQVHSSPSQNDTPQSDSTGHQQQEEQHQQRGNENENGSENENEMAQQQDEVSRETSTEQIKQENRARPLVESGNMSSLGEGENHHHHLPLAKGS